jgi:hypothetical protein
MFCYYCCPFLPTEASIQNPYHLFLLKHLQTTFFMSTSTTFRKNGEEIPPSIPSAFPRMSWPIAGLLLFYTIVYKSLSYIFSEGIWFLPPVADEFILPDDAIRSDLFAFQVVAGVVFVVIANLSVYVWYISRRVHTALPQTPEGRLFGYLPECEVLAAINFAYQLWDFVISFFIPEFKTAIFLGHHFVAGTVGWFTLNYQYLHYYGSKY